MKKDKIVNFIDKLLKSDIIEDNIAKENYKLLREIIDNVNFIEINNLNYIVKKSIPLLNKMFNIYQTFERDYFNKINSEEVNYNKIRKELHNYPSFDEKIAIEMKESINKIKNKYHYQLSIKNIKINIFFYSETEDINLFLNLAKIVFLFVSTFGINIDIYDNYNIRLLLIEFPRILDSKHQSNSTSFEDLGMKGYFNNSSGVHIVSKKELVVSRKSGITGLLIHELIHMLGLDFCFNKTERI